MKLLLLGASVAPLVVLAIYTLVRVPVKLTKTLSWHIAKTRSTILAGKICLTISGLFLIWWTVLSGLAIVLHGLLLIIAICFILLGLVPYGTSERRDQIHDRIAWIAAFAGMAFAIACMALGIATIFAVIALLIQLLFSWLFWVEKYRRYILLGQVSFFGAFYMLLAFI